MIATSGEQATRRFRVLLVLRIIKKDPWPLSKNVPPTGKENKKNLFYKNGLGLSNPSGFRKIGRIDKSKKSNCFIENGSTAPILSSSERNGRVFKGMILRMQGLT